MGKPRAERGFTLLELMVTVAIIAILAIVVVPYFFGESRKAKAKTEVAVMFAELGQKEEAIKIDTGQYFATTSAWPVTPLQTSQNLLPIPIAWTTLRVVIPQNQVYCSYQVFAGPANSAPTITATTGPFNMPICTPNCPTAWFTLFATCDMDGKPGFSEYFTNSTDSSIQVHNEGS
jgi:prepilin-type N-terminal cleavage/methylation domain-containing protein